MTGKQRDPAEYDIVVVGLGPTGDAMAALAALEGLSVLAVDRDPEPYPLPRAAVFDHEIMRIFQHLGVAETLAPMCRVPSLFQFVASDREVLVEMQVSGMPTASGWEASYGLHQPAVEAVLRQRAVELGAELRRGVTFTGFVQDDRGVDVSFDGPDGAETVRAGYLIGCDGGRSPIREFAGLPLFDFGFDEPWLVLDVWSDAHDVLPQTGLQVCDPERPTTFMRMTGDRYRWEFMLREGETAEAMLDDAMIGSLLARWIDPSRIRIERKAVYTFHGLVAEQWRSGRVLIAGDAAHQMPPFAGQGMCAGIRDAENLVWKLASVIRGEASDALLDSYQAERAGHVRAMIELSIAIGQIVCLQDPVAAAARDGALRERRARGEPGIAVAHPPMRGGCLTATAHAGELLPQPVVDGMRLDDALPPRFCLIGNDLSAHMPSHVTVFDLAAGDLAPFAPALRAWLGDAGAEAVLVRPDRHVFGVGAATMLLAALADALHNAEAVVVA